ncbi:J domain-containing protein required for chloroplast accumulation response 1 isoform X2 [Rhodamnia argentea]|uniref:J domain-containing protein required for chloroplast accumulation response 1 isoform X2 n=1 Tax=Rhodamnia argentea TaxID=178133 RepID=A0ABM3H2H8_9MYRT|nr:J domain-containing protein required for chloroplast accumulation response 1 isoform X2 [Rhodamnia argentea]
MERFPHKDDVLVDYSHSSSQREILGHGVLPKKLYRNSDIDFNDVFGGPPRRSSTYEMRYSLGEAADSYGHRGSGEIPSYRNPWTHENEKPVFGEENTSRRRLMSEDFFDDIFRGSESASSTPRKHDRDVFSSSPGSRIMSPVRPLPPRAEPLLSSSVPSQLSLPVTMSKPVDSTTLGSSSPTSSKYKNGSLNGASHPCSPKVSILGCPSRMTQVQDASKVVIQPSYRPSPLSHEFSLSGGEIMNANKSDKVHDSNKGTDQDMLSGAKFHFSIYKWASKGIPLAMPLRRANSLKSRERVKTESLSGNEHIDGQNWTVESASPSAENIDSVSLKSEVPNGAPSGVKTSNMESETVKQSCLEVEAETRHTAEEAGIDITRQKTLSSLRNSADGHSDAVPCNTRGETKSHSLPQTGLHQNMAKEEELSKPELKPLRSLLSDEDEQDSNNVKVDSKKEAETKSLRSTEESLGQNDADKGVKKQDGLGGLNSKGVRKVAVPGTPMDQRDGIGRRRAKGKVKEFIKIFNQEASLKPKFDVQHQGGGFRWNKRGGKADDPADRTNIGVERQVKASHAGTTDTITETSTHNVNQFHKRTDRGHSGRSTASFLFSDGSSEKKNSSASSTESTPEDARPTVIEIDESFSGNFVLKELPQDEDKQRQPSEALDNNIKVIDAKIRQWSRGKEGNIRSLLSTLQYVLWPKSGWKPVPLVEIIEGPAVKRAYQKALLCLHPDKLQQKGAASDQKYIAEQVFDILQEAWTHFNSLGSA